MSDPRDLALAKTFPVATVPRFGKFIPLGVNGQRLLIAENGFFLEVRRDWLYAIQPCATRLGLVQYPFGQLAPTIQLTFQKGPKELIEEFTAAAHDALPNEVAGAIVYNAVTGTLDLRICKSIEASIGHVRYAPPSMARAESIAVDIHSHAAFPKGFSNTDNYDDRSASKLAVVVGRVDTEAPDIGARLCLSGLFIPLKYEDGVLIDDYTPLHSE